MERREFLKKSVAASALLSASTFFSCEGKNDSKRILVLGGTYFVGPAIVNAALRNNHSVTLFNRGITNPDLFPELDLVKGDREQGIQAYDSLKNEKWDIVIDVWPEQSKLVDEATSALMDCTDHYIFISSIAVYKNFQEVGLRETSEVVDFPSNKGEWGYAEEKLAAELFVKERFKNNHTILRPGPIKGWRDPALDLLYWCVKLHRDDSIIAPGSGLDPLQFIDVNDVGKFAIMASENEIFGIYNCTGPMNVQLSWTEFLTISKQHFNSKTELVWANEDFLIENQVYSFSDLPLWAPLSEDKGFMQISNKKLIQTGFEFTPITSTLQDCMKWYGKHMDQNMAFGTPEYDIGLEKSRELNLIEKLKGHK